MGITGRQVRDDTLTGDDIDESTLKISSISDLNNNTKIQCEASPDEDKIRFDTNNVERMIITDGGNVGIGSASPNARLDVFSDRTVSGGVGNFANYHVSLRSNTGNNSESVGLAFGNSDDQDEIGASIVFEKTGSASQGELQFYTKQSQNNNSAPVKAMVIDNSGRVGIGVNSPSSPLHVYGNLNGTYVATIDNDQNTNGHVLKLSTDGNGSNSRVLEMEDGDGDIIFRARADGRFGFGPDGVSSMGAGTFVVGIDNSSHTSDIAISRRLQHLGDSNTYLDFPSADTFNLVAGGGSFLKYDNASSKILINNANQDRDTQIMASDGNVVLHIDAGTNNLGVATTSPNEALTVDGVLSIKERASVLANTANYGKFFVKSSDKKPYFLDSNNTEYDLSLGASSSAGNNKQVQFNNNGSFGGSNMYWDATDNRLAIDFTTAEGKLDVVKENSNAAEPMINLRRAYNGADGAVIKATSTRGTVTAQNANNNGDTLLSIDVYGRGSSVGGVQKGGSMYWKVAAAPAEDDLPTECYISNNRGSASTDNGIKVTKKGGLGIYKSTSVPDTTSDWANIYSKNAIITGHTEVWVQNSNGDSTKISPHNEDGEWEFLSRNKKTGKTFRVNMEKMIRRLEEITGEKFIEEYIEDID